MATEEPAATTTPQMARYVSREPKINHPRSSPCKMLGSIVSTAAIKSLVRKLFDLFENGLSYSSGLFSSLTVLKIYTFALCVFTFQGPMLVTPSQCIPPNSGNTLNHPGSVIPIVSPRNTSIPYPLPHHNSTGTILLGGK